MLIKCSHFLFSNHALKAMIERNIRTNDILEVINHGEIIGTYSDDKPYPVFFFLNLKIANQYMLFWLTSQMMILVLL